MLLHMPWKDAIALWVSYMHTAGLPTSTIGLRRHYLARTATAFPRSRPSTLTVSQLEAWLAGQRWKPNTRRSYRACLRAFYAWALASGVASVSPAHLLPPVKVPRPVPRPTPEKVFREAVRLAGAQDRLGLLLGGLCGLRCSEIARARREDLEPDLVGTSLRVVGKGGHVRLVPVPTALVDLIASRPAGWLFPSSHGGHLTPAHLGKRLSSNLPEGWTTHTLRHRCGTMAYAACKDLLEVQTLLGHAKPETTAIYVAVPMTSVRAWQDLDLGGAA